MLQHEFESRVKVQVSAQEYAAIEQVYMNSDLDKDQFCKMWVRINKTHIAQLKAAKAQAEEKAHILRCVEQIYQYTCDNFYYTGRRWYPALMPSTVTEVLDKAGINYNCSLYMFMENLETFIKAA